MQEIYESPAKANTVFLSDVVAGLSAEPKTLPCKYFYDETGSELFDMITTTDEYYPTRTEIGLICGHIDEIAHLVGPGASVVELGGGNETKARLLLSGLPSPRRYVPVDVAGEHLEAAARRMRRSFPLLETRPLEADFTALDALPADLAQDDAVLFFFAGSTIGNFAPDAARTMLARWRGMAPGCRLLLGVDLVKDRHILDAAYNDAAGYTAAFNLNLLEHVNRRLGADFDVTRFEHVARYVPERRRVEMHLRSLAAQRVHVGGRSFDIGPGETIHTESSYKYDVDGFRDLATAAGFRPVRSWTDPQEFFSLHLLRDAGS